MARIAGINIPQNKVVHVALTYIYGIGKKFSGEICSKLDISKNLAGAPQPLLSTGNQGPRNPCRCRSEN